MAFRKFKVITEDIQGKNHLTSFQGMDLTLDKMCSMVKKRQSMIEVMLMSRQLMVICFICFMLVSLKPETARHTEVLCASAGPADPGEDDGAHDLRSADK